MQVLTIDVKRLDGGKDASGSYIKRYLPERNGLQGDA